MLNKLKQEESLKIGVSLIIVTLLLLLLQQVGIMTNLCNGIEIFGKNVAGYETKEYVVSATNRTPIAMLQGIYIEQEIYLTQEILENSEIMFEIDVANYARINEGQLCVEIHQDDITKVFVTNMQDIKSDKSIRLITDTNGFKEGNIYINIYSPEATGDNCIAIYTVANTKVYSKLNISGEWAEANACIDLVIPSNFAKSDFVRVNVE